MRVLFATTECAPWVKTGGLGDVSAALPRALGDLGHDVRVLMPAYGGAAALLAQAESVLELAAHGPWPAARLAQVRAQGLELWLLDCPALYGRAAGPYVDASGRDHADNAVRFGFLSRVAAELGGNTSPWKDWRPDVLHANDWPTALAPAYLLLRDEPRAHSVLTIHNLAFQGEFDVSMASALELPGRWLDVDGLLHWGRISMLKAGIRYADALTTVSPTYAKEIQTESLGLGLDGMLRLRASSLVGILNGIDDRVWDPRRDAWIDAPYGPGDWPSKARNRKSLQAQVGLADDDGAMLLGMVSRLTDQKGVDLVLDQVDWIVAHGAQLVVLGAGDPELERRLRAQAAAHPGRIAAHVGFDDALAHRIEAGADAFLMPSRFEPCGLNQMYSLAYGTPPIVCATGGLADTVVDADASPDGNGFVLPEASSDALGATLDRVGRAFQDRGRWRALQTRGMSRSFGWKASASRYAALYEQLAARTMH